MTTQTNVFAYTAPGGSYPEYVSLNVRNGAFELTVRGPMREAKGPLYPFNQSGHTVCVALPPEQVEALRVALNAVRV